MREPTTAQLLLLACGVQSAIVFLPRNTERSRSHTKKGPGRVHQNGKPKEVQS